MQTPAVYQGGDGDHGEHGDQPAVQTVLRETHPAAALDPSDHGHVGELTADGGAEEEADSRGDVEEPGD